jgi:uncharacterized protein
MLIRVSVTNFRSFNEETEFNMLSASDQRSHKDHVYTQNGVELLKMAALYGANGAGKSNLIKAVAALQRIVLDSGKLSLRSIDDFKLGENQSKPTTLEVEYITGHLPYLFGITVQGGQIIEEWLYQSSLGQREDTLLFHRTQKEAGLDLKLANQYIENEEGKFRLKFYRDEFLKPDVSLFKLLAESKEGFADLKQAYGWFQSELFILFPKVKLSSLAAHFSTDTGFSVFARDFLKSLDTGIVETEIIRTKLNDYLASHLIDQEFANNLVKDLKAGQTFIPLDTHNVKGEQEEIIAMLDNDEVVFQQLLTVHKGRDGASALFSSSQRSDGTNRLMDYLLPLYSAIHFPMTVLIDEIDQSIHPVLLKELVQKFADNKATKGQLIFTTHESNLLDQAIFRRDEIWFVEKHEGATQLYPLSDFDIRLDLDIRKGYLNGRFGAIPFLGNLANLNWEQYAEA